MNNGYEGNNLLKIGELPTLRVVSGKELIFHEKPDAERLLSLVDRLGTEGILKNPPIVARIKEEINFVILDGANRVTALTKLGFKHFPVQIIDFEDTLLGLYCWNHVIESLDKNYFLAKLQKIRGIKINQSCNMMEKMPQFRDEKDHFCHIMFENGDGIFLSGGRNILDKASLLNQVTELYLSQPVYDRVSYSSLNHLKAHYPHFTALITFRQIDKGDFLKIVRAGKKLPAGITRVFLPKRALGLNIPLEFLKSELTLDEKNRWLNEMILKRVRGKSIRFYREPTFVFDE